MIMIIMLICLTMMTSGQRLLSMAETMCDGGEEIESIKCMTDPLYRKQGRSVFWMGSTLCTGWLAKSATETRGALVLTAGHCGFYATDNIYQNFVHDCGANHRVASRNSQPTDVPHCEITLLETSGKGSDTYSLYEVEADCAFIGELEPITIDVGRPDIGEGMYLIGHPNGYSQYISHQEEHDEGQHCVVERLTEQSFNAGLRARYWCDTWGGNSGSPVFSAKTGHAFAIHTNGGCASASHDYLNAGGLLENIADVLDQYDITYFNRTEDPLNTRNAFIKESLCPTNTISFHVQSDISKAECERKCINSLTCIGYEYDPVARNCEVSYEESPKTQCTGDYTYYERCPTCNCNMIYESADFGGASQCLRVGEYEVMDKNFAWTALSSFIVHEGLKLIFEERDGRFRTYREGSYDAEGPFDVVKIIVRAEAPAKPACYRALGNRWCRGPAGDSDLLQNSMLSDLSHEDCEKACNADDLCNGYHWDVDRRCHIYFNAPSTIKSTGSGTCYEKFDCGLPNEEIQPLSASLTSTHSSGDFPASNCIDGNLNTMCHGANGVAATLTVNIPRSVVSRVRINNRQLCCADRIMSAVVNVGGQTCGTVRATGAVIDVVCEDPIIGNLVTISSVNGQILNLMEVKIFGPNSEYVLVSDEVNCEAAGFRTISSADECEAATDAMGHPGRFVGATNAHSDRKEGCIFHAGATESTLFVGAGARTQLCNHRGYAGCICAKPKWVLGQKGDDCEEACAAIGGVCQPEKLWPQSANWVLGRSARAGIECEAYKACHLGESPMLDAKGRCSYCDDATHRGWTLQQDGYPKNLCTRKYRKRMRFCPCNMQAVWQ